MIDTSSTPSLLLVDDESSILASLRRLFRPLGYRIFTAGSGADGRAILEQESIDLVISDMRMPEMDGATFLKAVRQRWPHTLRILLTGYADISSTISAINDGEIYRYIAKPWDDTEMLSLVREATGRQRLEAENRRLTALTQAQNEELKALNAGLEHKVAERTAELRQALTLIEQAHGKLKKSFMTSVQVFTGLIELRSGPVGKQLAGHGRRVAEHARAIARQMALPEAEAQNIMLAGLLHDIGKIGLPDDLLGKPWNMLGAEQRALVMKHPAIGQNILLGIDRFSDAALIVRHHHECYDGSGYPDRLTALTIPLGARILAVANDYDAVQVGTLVQRPLKPAEALDFIVENSGKRYDPRVVAIFVKLIGETVKGGPVEIPLRTMHLKPGMTLSRDLMHHDGYLLLAAGSLLTDEIISQLVRMEQVEQYNLTVHIRQEEK